MDPRPDARHRWLVDALLALSVVVVLVTARTIYQSFTVEDFEPGRRAFGLGRWHLRMLPGRAWLSVAACAGGIVARRTVAGFTVAVLGSAAYLISGGAPVGAVVVAVVVSIGFLAGREVHASWPWLLLFVPAFASAAPLDLRHWLTVATMLAWTAVPIGLALAIRHRQAERAGERRDELERVAHVERLRLARDIHDVVGHSLSLITLQSGVALRVLDNDPSQARASLEAIRSTSKEALAEVRRTLGVFREEDAPLAPSPDLAAIATLVEQVRATGVSVASTLEDGTDVVAPSVQAVAHRIVQESLTNALRHAPGRAIDVSVTQLDGALSVRVHSDGQIPGPVRLGGGLTGMRERVDALGGTLRLDAGAAGFTVDARLPLERAT